LQLKDFLHQTAKSPLGLSFTEFKRFVDLQEVFHKVQKTVNPPRLQTVVEVSHKMTDCFGLKTEAEVSICKIEQMSNWERRPLRQSQLHYAALDAYTLSKVYTHLSKNPEFKEVDLAEFVIHKTY